MTQAAKTLIAITGGIGSGKSVVCAILGVMGYEVYDCDSRAREIMDNDTNLKQRIKEQVCSEAITAEGKIDRRILSAAVFSDQNKLETLNKLTHTAVLADLRRWLESTAGSIAFVETAILYKSGFDKEVDMVWEVRADKAVRLERVCRRNGLSEAEVEKRIAAQQSECEGRHPHIIIIENNGSESLLSQIIAAIDDVKTGNLPHSM